VLLQIDEEATPKISAVAVYFALFAKSLAHFAVRSKKQAKPQSSQSKGAECAKMRQAKLLRATEPVPNMRAGCCGFRATLGRTRRLSLSRVLNRLHSQELNIQMQAQDSLPLSEPTPLSSSAALPTVPTAPRPGIGLCLSGGGYRAMLFHVGAIWRLNEFGYLPKLERISSVSGGSITAGVLGLHWSSLQFDQNGVAQNLQQEFISPVRTFAGTTVDVWAILGGLLGPGTIGDRVADAYSKHLFGANTLQALPDRPRFVINSTNVQSGVLCRFSKPYMWDYRVGKIESPTIPLATAVAASSAFPPVLSPGATGSGSGAVCSGHRNGSRD
jgi:hypothetical protein